MTKKKKTGNNAASSTAASSAPQEREFRVVLPGDNVTSYITSRSKPKLGPGLRYDENQQIYATMAGRLHRTKQGAYFVQQNHRRHYQPRLEDRVIGIVQDRMGSDGAGGDLYRIEIGASHTACLSNLSFEGATKRNKPSLASGQLLYARVSELHTALNPVLSCRLGPHDHGMVAKDWMTNEGGYGPLVGGTACRISTGLARELLHPNNLVLTELANAQLGKGRLAFEVAIGVNGMLWVHSKRPEYTVLIQNAIQNSAVLTEPQVRAMVQKLVYTTSKRIQQEQDAMQED